MATHAGFQTGASLRGAWAGPLARMDFGVALFFVLSGFLLFRPHAAVHLVGRSAPQTVPYLKRRALRILPAYWVVVVVAMVVFAENRQLGIRDWLVQLLLLQTYVPNGLVTGLQQMWSLGTEVAFYLALPLIGLLVRRLPGRTVARRAAVQLGFLGVLAAIAIVYRLVVFDHTVYGRAQYWLPGYLDWFAVGMALATIYTLVSSGEPLPRWAAGIVDVARAPGACFAAGAAVLWVSTARIAGPYDLTPPTVSQALFKHVSYAVAAGLLLAPATIRPHPGGAFAAIMGNSWMRSLGTVSYGVFLWNMLVLQVFVRIIDQRVFTGSWLLDFTVTWSVSVAIAFVSWQVVERRFLRPRRQVRSAAGDRRCPLAPSSAASPITTIVKAASTRTCGAAARSNASTPGTVATRRAGPRRTRGHRRPAQSPSAGAGTRSRRAPRGRAPGPPTRPAR